MNAPHEEFGNALTNETEGFSKKTARQAKACRAVSLLPTAC
ncbi:hypothetical protein [Paraburkholderia translucens]|nr:hypothetical protein [Paraburkholderia sp. MMS20-SJTN17]